MRRERARTLKPDRLAAFIVLATGCFGVLAAGAGAKTMRASALMGAVGDV